MIGVGPCEKCISYACCGEQAYEASPTPEAYDAACRALHRAKEELESARAEVAALKAAKWSTGFCSAHQQPDPLCRVCNPLIAELESEAAEAKRERDALHQKLTARGALPYLPTLAELALPRTVRTDVVGTAKQIEREACARVAREKSVYWRELRPAPQHVDEMCMAAAEIAAAICARSK